MIITIEHLRAAGLSEAQINQVIKTVESETLLRQRTKERNKKKTYRLRQKSNEINKPVHHGSVPMPSLSTTPMVDKDEQRKSKKLKDINGSVHHDPVPVHRRRGGHRTQTQQITAEWRPKATTIDYAQRNGWSLVRIEGEIERYRNHYLFTGDARADWDRGFMKWVTSPYQKQGGASFGTRSRTSRRDSRIAEWEESLRAMEAGQPGGGGPAGGPITEVLPPEGGGRPKVLHDGDLFSALEVPARRR